MLLSGVFRVQACAALQTEFLFGRVGAGVESTAEDNSGRWVGVATEKGPADLFEEEPSGDVVFQPGELSGERGEVEGWFGGVLHVGVFETYDAEYKSWE